MATLSMAVLCLFADQLIVLISRWSDGNELNDAHVNGIYNTSEWRGVGEFLDFWPGRWSLDFKRLQS